MEFKHFSLIMLAVILLINVINWVFTSTKKIFIKVVCILLHIALLITVIITAKIFIQCPQ